MKEFAQQVAVVTGSTRGIGKEIARQFAQAGAQVIVMGRQAEQAEQTADEINKEGGKAEGLACDVANAENVQKTVNLILDKYKRIDILINNAGITKDNLLLRLSEADFFDVLNINLGGVFHFTKLVSKAMLKAKSGRIINIASIIGITGNAGQANYAASKAGIIGFTKSLAREVASRNITVNAVAPGYIATEMTENLTDDARQRLMDQIPLGRIGETKDVANLVAFLASDLAGYVTGQVYNVDGGLVMQG